MEGLPQDLISQIMKEFTFQEVLRCATVCKTFAKASNDLSWLFKFNASFIFAKNLFEKDSGVFEKALQKWPKASSIRELDLSHPYSHASGDRPITVALQQLLPAVAATLTKFRMYSFSNIPSITAALAALQASPNLEVLELECDSIIAFSDLNSLFKMKSPKLYFLRLPLCRGASTSTPAAQFVVEATAKLIITFPNLKDSLCIQTWLHTSLTNRHNPSQFFATVAHTDHLIKHFKSRGRLGEYTRLLTSVADYLLQKNPFQSEQLLQALLAVDPTAPGVVRLRYKIEYMNGKVNSTEPPEAERRLLLDTSQFRDFHDHFQLLFDSSYEDRWLSGLFQACQDVVDRMMLGGEKERAHKVALEALRHPAVQELSPTRHFTSATLTRVYCTKNDLVNILLRQNKYKEALEMAQEVLAFARQHSIGYFSTHAQLYYLSMLLGDAVSQQKAKKLVPNKSKAQTTELAMRKITGCIEKRTCTKDAFNWAASTQVLLHCHSCDLTTTKGICASCAIHCHSGHDISVSSWTSSLCSCKACATK